MRGLAIAAATLLLAGCSAIVGGDPPAAFSCRVVAGAADPCGDVDPALRCSATDGTVGTCQPQACGVEICGNAIDDDCDGMADELDPTGREECNERDDDCDGEVDEDLDEDGDGASWCRTSGDPFDCNDNEARARPETADNPSPELCDGIDNDCNTTTADGEDQCDAETEACKPLEGGCRPVYCDTRGSLCTADQFCDLSQTPPACASRDSRCFTIACTGGMRCNPSDGMCVMPQPDGTFCDHDSQCQSNLCISGAALLASADLDGRDGICGTTCCSDDDCGTGFRCWVPGTGARACVPTSLLEQDTTYGAPTRVACGSRSDCPEECVFGEDDAYEIAGRNSMGCGTSLSGARPRCTSVFDCGGEYTACRDGFCMQEACRAADECPSGLCSGNILYSDCREPCGSAGDCPRSSIFSENPGCVYTEVERTGGSGRSDWIQACRYSTEGSGAGGASCTQDSDCRDSACVDESGNPFGEGARSCSDTCCNDDDCAGQQCRPIAIHGHWETHCLPEPDFPALGGA